MPLKGNRPPLNIKVTGTIQEKGYHIEKLYYESLPGLYVRANLYVPDYNKKPMPAILYVCGHSPTQKVHYQAHPRKFAQLGFVFLIIETIQFGEVRGEHWGCYGVVQLVQPGLRSCRSGVVECYTGIGPVVIQTGSRSGEIRSNRNLRWRFTKLVYCCSRSTGKSGSPLCGASTLKAQITTRTIDGHCDCMMSINTYRQDFTDIGALIAPRPLLICQADRDGLNKIEAVRDLYRHIRKIYKLYNATDKIALIETPGGHSYHKISREGMSVVALYAALPEDHRCVPDSCLINTCNC